MIPFPDPLESSAPSGRAVDEAASTRPSPAARDDGTLSPARDDGALPLVRGDDALPPFRDDGMLPPFGDDGTLPPVLHVDDWLLVVDKPAGLLSVTGRGPAGADCVHARLLRHWPDALVVHRLDMATSGLMVFARGPQAQRLLSRAFAERAVHKRYVAVVAGRPRPEAIDAQGWATIDLPLAADWPARPRQKVDAEHGRPSLTRWRAAAPAPGPWGEGTRLALQPVTGRSHQLRVHLAHLGHPIVGDALYAPEPLAQAAPRLLLHAERLALAHPADGRALDWRCAAPF